MANEAVSGSPIPSEVDTITGNHAHDFDLGRAIGQNGETKVRVWVNGNREVQTMHPIR